MTHKKKIFFVIASVLYSFTILPAQELIQKKEKTIVGIWGDIQENIHRSNFFFFPGVDACGSFTNGDALRPAFGMFADVPLQKIISGSSKNFLLHASAGYHNYSGMFTAPPADTFRRLTSGTSMRVDREHRLRSSINAISGEALFEWQSPWKISFAAGPRISFLTSRPTYLQTENILSPEGTVYRSNGEPIDTLGQGTIPNTTSALASFIFRASYTISLNNHVVVIPEASLALPLNKLSSSLSWNISPVALGVGVGYVFDEEEIIEQPLPVVRAKKMPALAVVLALNGLDQDGRIVPAPAIYLGKTIVNEEIALVPAIFFDSASSVIPSRYTKRNETAIVFGHPDSLATINALDVAHDILNIIGSRMQERPLATLHFNGASGTETKNLKLARKRAEQVEEYLVTAWSIDPSRIEITASDLPIKPSNVNTFYGQEENRRVDISSDDYEIVKPFATKSVEKRYVSPPGLLMEPTYVADTTITSWDVLVGTKKKNILTFHGDDITELVNSRRRWMIDPQSISDDEDSVHVDLILEDAIAQRAQSRASLPVYRTWEESSRHYATKFENVQIERFNVITFDFDKVVMPEKEEKRLENAIGSLSNDATLRVVGYADLMTGDAEYNKKLSDERAQFVSGKIVEAANARGVYPKNVSVSGEGQKNLFDNTLPEGRFLSRTVKIEITKPLK